VLRTHHSTVPEEILFNEKFDFLRNKLKVLKISLKSNVRQSDDSVATLAIARHPGLESSDAH